MLGYEWAHPLVMSSVTHSGEVAVTEQPHHRRQICPFYDSTGVDLFSGLSTLTPPPPPLAISPMPVDDFAFRQGDASWTPSLTELPPATRIGLNLGMRTYFASAPVGEPVQPGAKVCKRSGGGSGGVVATATTARCQAEGCGEDLNRAKHYHRKHKVCELHSRAAAVVVHGLSRRFCQQCSRFHVLSEFDQGKRSCRKRLAEHNRRRRKTKPPPPRPSQPHRGTAVTAVPKTVAPPRSSMKITKCSGSSSPSPCSSSSMPSINSVLPCVPGIGLCERPVPMSIWDTNADEQQLKRRADVDERSVLV